MTAGYEYAGSELELFAQARNWKAYWKRAITPWIRGDVLEVGAGIGTNTPLLRELAHGSWTCLEPDNAQLERARVLHARELASVRHVVGTLESLPEDERFDTLLYLDVLEHIADDREELRRAARRLRPDGRVVVLSPAHQGLFTEFDRAIGHHRRYDKRSLSAAGPEELVREALFYLDSVGLCASLANRLVLHQSSPSLGQVRTWDSILVPASRLLDPLLLRSIGKSIVAVWRR